MIRSRKTILEVLTRSDAPLSAVDIFSRMNGDFDQATVYRNLHWLEDKGLADSFVLNCSEHGTERYYTHRDGNRSHHHWFHCMHCHAFTDLGDCALDQLVDGYQHSHGISILSHTLYFTGLCLSCSKSS